MKQLPAELNRCPWAKSDLYVEYHDTENGACLSMTTDSCSSS